jgi:hypothetical protein
MIASPSTENADELVQPGSEDILKRASEQHVIHPDKGYNPPSFDYAETMRLKTLILIPGRSSWEVANQVAL